MFAWQWAMSWTRCAAGATHHGGDLIGEHFRIAGDGAVKDQHDIIVK